MRTYLLIPADLPEGDEPMNAITRRRTAAPARSVAETEFTVPEICRNRVAAAFTLAAAASAGLGVCRLAVVTASG